jgi:hypothetical protein
MPVSIARCWPPGITNAPEPDLERWRLIAETIADPDGG